MNPLKILNVLASFLFLVGSIFFLEPTKFNYITPALFLVGSLCALISNIFETEWLNFETKWLIFKKEWLIFFGQLFFVIATILQLSVPDNYEYFYISLYIAGSFFLTIYSILKINPNQKLQFAFLNCGPFFFLAGSSFLFNFENVGAILFIIGSFFYFFLEIFFEKDHQDLFLVTALLIITAVCLIVFENNFEWAFDETTSTEINCFIIVSTFLSLANNLPQLIHSYKETDLSNFKGFSTSSLWIWLFGSICWLIFASGLKKTVLIIHSCISIFSATFLLYLIKKN